MEKATFYMEALRITQKANSNFSHRGVNAIDVAGYDTKIESLKAPFTGVVKRIYKDCNAVWLESKDKVKYANGKEDYMTVMTLHDNDVSNLYVGKVIKQGEVYYEEGTKGKTTGAHIHIAVGSGKFTGTGWYENSNGEWCINNQMNIYDALYLPKNIKIIDNGGYNWKYINDDVNTYIVKKGDTLSTIAKNYKTTVENLVKINNIKDKNKIYINQILYINNNTKNNIIYYKKYTGNTHSIVDALKSIGENSSYNERVKIASINSIKNYTGTSFQNKKMLELLKEGKLIKKAN